MVESLLEKREYLDFSRGVHEAGSVVKAQLELTYRCNLRCAHCYTDPYNKKEFFPRELSTGELKRVIDELAGHGVLWLNLTGGEVFARADFFEVYEHAWDRGLVVSLFTNGTCFTGAILERLKARPPFVMEISCHSVSREAFDRFTQVPGSFDRFMAGMEKLAASGLPFRLKTKAMRWNKDELGAIKKYAESLGKAFSFTTSLAPRLNGDLSSLAHRLPPDEARALEDAFEVWREDEESCRSARAGLGPADGRLYRCGCGTHAVHISAWGELGTCAHEYEARASLREMPVAEAVAHVFSKVKSMRFASDSPCGPCGIHAFCDRFPTQMRLETGDRESATEYHCDMAHARAERLTKMSLEHPLAHRRTT